MSRIKSVISDLDGVFFLGETPVPGANDFIARLKARGIPLVLLTNNCIDTRGELLTKFAARGISGLTEENIITASVSTAAFISQQDPGARVSVVGAPGLSSEIEAAGCTITDEKPEYVVVGKYDRFDWHDMKRAIRHIMAGAMFLGTNPDILDPTEDGIEPSTGCQLAAIESGCGVKPYIVGKPNSLMMTIATRRLGVHPDDTLMIGDRMDTDIVGGMEAGMQTCLILSGVTTRQQIHNYPYRPDFIFDSIADIDLDRL